MKINVEFDLTPAEFRQAMGLPDIEGFQRELMSRIQQQMEAGVEGYDPWSLMQPFMQQGLNQGFANFGNYQQMMLDMMRKAGASSRQPDSSTSSEDTTSDQGESRRGSASATSRQGRKT